MIFELYENMPGVDGCLPITRESFLAAYVDANPLSRCRDAVHEWNAFHSPIVWNDEIDEDPPRGEPGVESFRKRVRGGAA